MVGRRYGIITGLSLVWSLQSIDAYCTNCYSCSMSSCYQCDGGYYAVSWNNNCYQCSSCTAGTYQSGICDTDHNTQCSTCTNALPDHAYYKIPLARNMVEASYNCAW